MRTATNSLIRRVRSERSHASHLARDQVHCAVDADRQHVIVAIERAKDRAHAHIRTEPADARLDRFAGFGMNANDPRQ